MKRVSLQAFLILTIFAFTLSAVAQKNDDNRKNEFGFTIGGESIPGNSTRTTPSTPIDFDSSVAYQLHYGRRLFKGDNAALSFEVPATAAPSHSVSSTDPANPVSLASFYVTPAFRLTFRPSARVSPWLSFGGGYGLYEGSVRLGDGTTNLNRYSGTGALQWGAGADFKTPLKIIFPISLRGEVRDFYTLDTLNFNHLVTQQLSDGAIQYTSIKINPYFGNLAALGWLDDLSRLANVKSWIQWYVAHLNTSSDIWSTGTGGTMYDYNISGGVTGTSLGTADSTDSYAATFLSVVWNYYSSTGADTAYIASIQTSLDNIGKAILFTQDSDGLTWAKPDYHIEYLEDNSEVFRGLTDLASLFTALSNPRASTYSAAASACQTGVLTLYLSGPAAWSPYKDNGGSAPAPNGATWYPDSVSQLFPVINGLVAPSDAKAIAGYAFLNAHWSNWPTLPWNHAPTNDPFPWCLVGYGAALMGDTTRVDTYIQSVNTLYYPTFAWHFYCAEAGWYMRMNFAMEGSPPSFPPGARSTISATELSPCTVSRSYMLPLFESPPTIKPRRALMVSVLASYAISASPRCRWFSKNGRTPKRLRPNGSVAQISKTKC